MKRLLKQSFKLLFFVIVFWLCLFVLDNKAFAENYYIKDYDITIDVNEDNTFDIDEKIEVDYGESSYHGIYRTIPYINVIERDDGTIKTIYSKLKNVDVDNKFRKSTENGYKIIKIGDANKYVTGIQNYNISYKYDMGIDSEEEFDEFYFNPIGTKWECYIQNADIVINFPKSFDTTQLQIYSGALGETGSEKVEYEVDSTNNKITIKTTETLIPGEAVTVKLKLDEGYFNRKAEKITPFAIIVIIACVGAVGYTFSIYKKYKANEKIIETVEFYPPDNLLPTTLQKINQGIVYNDSVVSLLIVLANKGYLKIKELTRTTKSGKEVKDGFEICKVKNYDGDNEQLKTFFKGLFKNKNTVTRKDLEDVFYATVNFVAHIANDEAEEKYFNKVYSKFCWRVFWVTVALVLLTFVYFNTTALMNIINISVITAITYVIMILGEAMLLAKSKVAKVFGSIFGIVALIGVYCGYNTLTGPSVLDLSGGIVYVICTISVIALFYFMYKFPRLNEKGDEIKGKILGFIQFLKVGRKDELEALVEKDPTYFYDILPYTYTFGISKKWIKQFEGIAIQPPSWYDSPTTRVANVYSVTSALSMIDSLNSISSSMTSSPSSSVSSGSSGGGYSGGGSGGGGGGAW